MISDLARMNPDLTKRGGSRVKDAYGNITYKGPVEEALSIYSMPNFLLLEIQG